jgi:hypothetical protein
VVTGIFTCYNHVFMKVLNYRYIYRVAVIPKYIYLGMWYLVYCFHCVLYIYLLWGWAAMNFSAGMLTAQRVVQLDTYIERIYVCTVYTARILNCF